MTNDSGDTEKSNRILFRILVLATVITTIPVVMDLLTDTIKVEAQNQGIDASSAAPIPGEQSDDDVVNCAALGCPGNPPNPHGPPTEEPEGDE
jgi:hypothetical protein